MYIIAANRQVVLVNHIVLARPKGRFMCSQICEVIIFFCAEENHKCDIFVIK